MHVVPITVLDKKSGQMLSTGQDLPVADRNTLLIFTIFVKISNIIIWYKELTDSPAI